MKAIYEWGEGIIIFLIISSALFQLIVPGKYRKYMRLFIGMMLVLLVVNPILSLFQLKDGYEFEFDNWSNFAQTGEFSDMTMAFSEAELKREEQILSEYKTNLTARAEEIIESYGYEVVSLSLEIGEEAGAEDYYQVKYLEGKIEKKEKESLDFSKVEEITVNAIPKIDLKQEKQEEFVNLQENEETKIIKSKIADFYNIEPENINIGIQEGRNGA